MAWEWSHTPEAYSNAQTNLENIEPDTLRVIWAEWKALTNHAENQGFDTEAYELALNDCQPLGPVRLASDIWERAADFRTCDNGGFNAYVCPYGCHTVPFDLEASS